MNALGRVETEHEEAPRDLRSLNRVSTLKFRVLGQHEYALCNPYVRSVYLVGALATFNYLCLAYTIFTPYVHNMYAQRRSKSPKSHFNFKRYNYFISTFFKCMERYRRAPQSYAITFGLT